MCWGLWELMWASGVWTQEAIISLFKNVLSTSGMLGAGVHAGNLGERGISLSERGPHLPVAALWNNPKAGLPLLGASFLSNNFVENAG